MEEKSITGFIYVIWAFLFFFGVFGLGVILHREIGDIFIFLIIISMALFVVSYNFSKLK